MRTTIRSFTVLLIVLGSVSPLGASAGTPVDPNQGDHVFGVSGGLRYAAESQQFNSSGSANVEVGCGGPNWHLLGGGSASAGPPAQTWLSASQPVDYTDPGTATDDGWSAYGNGAPSARLTGYSVCIHGGSLRYRTKTLADAPSGRRTGSVGCGAPTWHVTNGSAFIATTGSWVHSSFPRDGNDPGATPDDAWTGSVYDAIGGIGGFSVHAICARGLALRYVRRPPVKVSSGTAVVRTVTCKPREHVVGGGAHVSGPADRSRLLSSVPFDGKDAGGVPDDGWQSRVYGVSGGNKKVTAFAICLG